MMNKENWQDLAEHYKKAKNLKMRDLFAKDDKRAGKFTLSLGGMYFDYSKNRITEETMQKLVKLAKNSGLKQKIEDMFSGKKINTTENRAVLHTALRNLKGTPVLVDNKDVMPEIKAVLAKMKRFSDAVRSGEFSGYTGKKLTNIVNIGIGGSDLGPAMVCEALKPYWQEGINCYFISNVDGTACAEVLNKIDAESTLFIVASKTFTTIETLTNAKTCRDWLVGKLGEKAVANHFVALSTNAKAVAEFGINTENMFEFWDFVGGRYSVWSAIGLIVAIAIGFENFEQFLAGAEAMDEHFRNAEFSKNIPVIMALLTVWYTNFFGFRSHCVVPYDEYLRMLPAYLQQLVMESNGKYVDLDGNHITKYQTSAAVFGGAGTNVQHSFFQMLHQGTQIIPLDFIIPANSHNALNNHHNILISNVLAQAEAMMKGKTSIEVAEELAEENKSIEEIARLAPYKTFEGNRPSNMFVFDKITPYNLGKLIAAYEHKTFVEGVIYNIDSFDQWGVELGKKLAKEILPELEGCKKKNHDSSTSNLIKLICDLRK